jgi:hypothetical protein
MKKINFYFIVLFMFTLISINVNSQTTWTSDNSNLSTVDWKCNNLTASGNINIFDNCNIEGWQDLSPNVSANIWYEVAKLGNASRGAAHLRIETLGGVASPAIFEVTAYKDWSGGFGLTSKGQKSSSTCYLNGIRIRENNGEHYVDVRFSSNLATSVKIYLSRSSWYYNATAGTLTVDPTGTIVKMWASIKPNMFEGDAVINGNIVYHSANLPSSNQTITGNWNFNGANVGIGTTSPDYELDVIGTIRAQEVKVNMDGADFVFEDDYNLQSLSEVETFIKENKHLPDIAPAKEMQKNGVSVGEMDQKLLQKIEELTLYVIGINKKVELLEAENMSLRNNLK